MVRTPRFLRLVLLAGLTALANPAWSAPQQFTSQTQRTTLIELYTSEGCSSCPPAERWLSSLKDNAQLWRQFVPVAFHVGYWDYLGWRDRFADPRFAARQSDYQKRGYVSTVYTPGVMRAGREWRKWIYGNSPVSTNESNSGILHASLDNGTLTVEFTPSPSITTRLKLNVALLGFNLTTQVAAGENEGKRLNHDFTVLKFNQQTQAVQQGHFYWTMSDIKLPKATKGIALWVSAENDPTPLQATGGWLR